MSAGYPGTPLPGKLGITVSMETALIGARGVRSVPGELPARLHPTRTTGPSRGSISSVKRAVSQRQLYSSLPPSEAAMSTGLVSRSTVTVHANPDDVWKALTDPTLIRQYMFGADVQSDWTVGSPITWKGEYNGRHFEDKGEITALVPGKRLGYTHYSALSGKPDVPANHHNVDITLEGQDGVTRVVLAQDGNASEQERERSVKNWDGMLQGLRKTVEG